MTDITDEENEMRKALKCLYLEVDASIADDISDKFNAFAALSQQNKVSDEDKVMEHFVESNKSAYWLYENDKVNSLLTVSLMNLSPDELIALRDSLIERTPKEDKPISAKIIKDLLNALPASTDDKYLAEAAKNARKYLEDKPIEPISDAVEFGEWLQENRWFSFQTNSKYHPNEKRWYYTFEQGTAMDEKSYQKNYVKTTQQLYDKFKSKPLKNLEECAACGRLKNHCVC